MEQTINPPDLDDLLAESRNAVFANMNCVQVGQLQKINNDQTVEIKIQFLRRLPDGKTAKYPLLVDCPYFVLNGGGSYIDLPITKGDYCIVLFNDRNIDDWWDTANISIPPDTRKHSISDGFALVGINPKAKALSFDGSALRIVGPGGTLISMKDDGSIEMNAPAGLKITGNTEITGTLTVSGIIKSLVDIIADYAVTAISLLNHLHIANLNWTTQKPTMTPVAKPSPILVDDDLDMNGKDLLNVKNSVGGQTNHSAHGHQQGNDSNGDTEVKTNGPS